MTNPDRARVDWNAARSNVVLAGVQKGGMGGFFGNGVQFVTRIFSRGPGRPVLEQLETRTLFDGQLDTGWASGGVAIGINPGATNVGSVDVLLNGNLVAGG